jgi:drug/metabolite transporter (DMT)-like permease
MGFPYMKAQHLVGIFFSLMAYFGFSVGDALRKHMSTGGLDPFYIIMWSSVFSAIFMVGFCLYKRRLKKDLTLKRPIMSVSRGFMNLLLGYLAILSFQYLAMTDAYILIMTAPIIGIVCFSLFFKEPIKPYKIGAVCLGFIGAVLVIKPGFGEWNNAYLAAIGVAIVFVLNNILLKKVVHVESKVSLIFYPNMVNIGCGMLILGAGAFQIPQGFTLGILMVAACTSLVGGLSMAWAIERIEASEVSLYHYVQVFYGVVIGYLFFHEHPDIYALGGIFAIVLSGAIIYRGAKRRHEIEFIEMP